MQYSAGCALYRSTWQVHNLICILLLTLATIELDLAPGFFVINLNGKGLALIYGPEQTLTVLRVAADDRGLSAKSINYSSTPSLAASALHSVIKCAAAEHPSLSWSVKIVNATSLRLSQQPPVIDFMGAALDGGIWSHPLLCPSTIESSTSSSPGTPQHQIDGNYLRIHCISWGLSSAPGTLPRSKIMHIL